MRTRLMAGDIPQIVRYHDEYYARTYGFSHDFGNYVEGPLTEFYNRRSPDEGIWLVDDESGIRACVALVRNSNEQAQLRWFYVDEPLRGRGLGNELIGLLIEFARSRNYQEIILWTVSLLSEARRLYERNGFILAEEHEAHLWGMDLTEQKFVRKLIGKSDTMD